MSCSRGGGRWRRLPETGWFCSAPVPPVLSPHPNTPAAPGTRPVGQGELAAAPAPCWQPSRLPADVGAVNAPRAFGSLQVPVSRAAA